MNICAELTACSCVRTSVPTERRKDPTSYPASTVTQLVRLPASLTGLLFMNMQIFCSRIISGQIYVTNYLNCTSLFLRSQALSVSSKWRQYGTFSDRIIGNDGPIEIYIFSIFDKKELKIQFWRPWNAWAIW